MAKNVVILMTLILLFAYGLFCVVWPEKASEQLLSYYDVEAPSKWHKPATWLKFRPGPLAFRILGLVLVGFSLLLIKVVFFS
jgi:hypothetical protein